MASFTKLEVARIQLEKAIELFFDGEHLCALTLAGAAEEILGTLNARAGNERASDWLAKDTVLRLSLEGVAAEKKEVRDLLNHARNAAKHADTGQGLVDLELGWEDSAQMILRGVWMARDLGVRTDLQNRFIDWFSSLGHYFGPPSDEA